MGYSDYFIQTVTTEAVPSTSGAASAGANPCVDDDVTDAAKSAQKSDQEILESIEDCYYEADSNLELYELKVSNERGVWGMEIPNKTDYFEFYRKFLEMELITN